MPAARGGTTGPQHLRAIAAQIRSGWPPGVTVLSGDDTYHLDRAQQAILGALVPRDATEFALTVYGDERVSVGTVVASARSVGMFDPRRVVVVRGAETLEGDPEPLEEYAATPPPGSFLVIRAPNLDKRFKLHKALAKIGVNLTFDRAALAGTDLEKVVVAMAKERELDLGRGVARALTEYSDLDLHAVASELDKLSAYLGGEGTRRVTAKDLEDVGTGSAAVIGFEIARAVLVRDLPRAISECRAQVDGGEEPIKLLGGVALYARTMLQAKAMLARGAPRPSVKRLRGAWNMGDALFHGLERYTLDELLAFPYHLAEADRALKSRSLDGGAILEDVVRRLVRRAAAESR